MDQQRRRFLQLGGASALAALAGCSGGGGDSTASSPNDTAGGTAAPGESSSTAETETSTAVDYGGWFDDTSNYDGTTLDMTGESSVTVTVGADGNDGAFAFDPPAILVDTGTAVTWEWSGEGGSHNVVANDGSFKSGSPTDSGSWEHTFEEEGTFKYFCDPHDGLGMRGAVVAGEPGGGGDEQQTREYAWQAATFDSYWYSLYNMSTNIAMSGNGVLFPSTDQQQQQFQQRITGITQAADVDRPPINNPNLNMLPFTEGSPRFTEEPVFEDSTGRPNAETLMWDRANSSGVVSPSSLAWTHLKGVTWAKNFEKHFEVLPENIAPKFRAQVLTTLAQIGTNAGLIGGGPDGNGLLTKGESLELVSEVRPSDATLVDGTTRVSHHTSMLWFLSNLTSLAQGGWFGYENPEPLIPAENIQQLTDGLAQTTMNAFTASDVASQSSRTAGLLLGALGWYGTHAGQSELHSQAADYANSLADEIDGATDGNGLVGNGARNQAATQGAVGQGLLWASQVDGVDRTAQAETVLGYMLDELWDDDADTFAEEAGDGIYTISARDAGDITGGLNAADAVLGTSGVQDRFARFFDATFNTGNLQRAQRPPSMNDRENEPPAPPAAGGSFGQAAVYNNEVEYDTNAEQWTVTDDRFHTADALYLANQDIWVGNWAGDFYQGRGVPGQSDTPP